MSASPSPSRSSRRTRGWLGQINQDIADSLGLASNSGAIVTDSQSDSPAQKAGIREGPACGHDDRRAAGSACRSSRKLPDQQTASVEQPATPAEPSALEDFGMSIAPSDDKRGVVITDVDPNGQAAERGLQPGDVILSVGDTPVTDPAAVEEKMAVAKAGGLKAVLLRVQSGDQTRFVALSFARA
jgi:serine protease Do